MTLHTYNPRIHEDQELEASLGHMLRYYLKKGGSMEFPYIATGSKMSRYYMQYFGEHFIQMCIT